MYTFSYDALITCLKMSKRRTAKLILLLLIYYLIVCVLYESYFQETKKRHILCVTNSIGLSSPTADGIIMKPHLPLPEWPFYYDGPFQDDRRIFFHETSGLGELSLKQCCAIESAAKHNPERPVQVFLRPMSNCYLNYTASSSTMFNSPWLKILSQYVNVDVILINEDFYFSGTQLEQWYRKGEWRKSKYQMVHLSDYIRILTQFKGGGLYLDIDLVSLKSLSGEKFRNFLVYSKNDRVEIANAAMHLERDHWMSHEIIKLIAQEYDPQEYLYHGPEVVREVMNRICGLSDGVPSSNQCSDVRILPSHLFYPIPYVFSNILFKDMGNETTKRILTKLQKSFGLHLTNSLSPLHEPLDMNSGQVFAIIARKTCPLTAAQATNFQSY